ncbi:MAG TPA: TonB family protein [Verrucomicrobiae bacterium]|nr:TonB family protein [Verrucomicrobiae bacterium]
MTRTSPARIAALLLMPLCAVAQEPAPSAAPRTLQPLASARPVLSDAACQQRLSGYVDLAFAVLPDGKVADVKITGAQPAGAFDEAAIAAVAARTYPPQDAPVKMKERLPMSFADCRAEQLRPVGAAAPANDCPALDASARAMAAPFADGERARSAIEKAGAQAYSAPSEGCAIAGKKLGYGAHLEAQLEFQRFSLVAPARKGAEPVWVLSNQLKDLDR